MGSTKRQFVVGEQILQIPYITVAVLDALGVRHALLAVTKSDLADPAPVLADVRERLLARVSAGWNPEEVHREGRQAVTDWATLSRWARKVMPPCPDALEIPPPSLEADVELL